MWLRNHRSTEELLEVWSRLMASVSLLGFRALVCDRTRYANSRFANPIRRIMPQKPYMTQLHKSQRKGLSKSLTHICGSISLPDSEMLFVYTNVVSLFNNTRDQNENKAIYLGWIIEKTRESREELTQVFNARLYASSEGITVTFCTSTGGTVPITGMADIASSEKPAMTES